MSSNIPIKYDSPFEWKSPIRLLEGFGKTYSSHNDFKVEVDVHGYKPNEVEVKVFGKEVTVHCLHEDPNNRRELSRSYRLPEDVEPSTLKSELSHSGMLTVSALRKDNAPHRIPVHHGSSLMSSFPHSFGEFPSLFGAHRRAGFETELDVHDFAPNEVDVKVVGHDVVIKCLHEGKDVKREVNRSYTLPGDVDPSTVRAEVSRNGMLTVTAEKRGQ